MATKVYNGLDLQSQKITSLATPSADTDAVNKAYVDAALNGLRWKESVRAATTANVNLTTDVDAGSSLDGVTLAEDDRILLKNQTDASENGIYLVPAAAGTATRANDADSTAEVQSATVLVEEGTVNADTAWTQTADDVVVDTDDMTWVAFGGGASYTFGDGLVESGGDVDIELNATSGLTLGGGTLALADTVAGDGLTISSKVLAVGVGDGLDVAADAVSVDAGAGLTFTSGALVVGEGDGINVAADAIAVDAGAGLTFSTGALVVGEGTGMDVTADAVGIDTSVVVRKYAENVGDGSATTWNVDHDLGTRDVTVMVYRAASPWDMIICDVEMLDTNNITLNFAVAPASNEYRCVVHG
jgi:hypothetical protein